jgi:hypothetical protein
VWSFDGLSLRDPAYAGAHVMIEPYPSAVRGAGVAQSDESDSLASADEVRRADHDNEVWALLDLSMLSEREVDVVRVEGWIASHRPELQRTGHRPT